MFEIILTRKGAKVKTTKYQNFLFTYFTKYVSLLSIYIYIYTYSFTSVQVSFNNDAR